MLWDTGESVDMGVMWDTGESVRGCRTQVSQ